MDNNDPLVTPARQPRAGRVNVSRPDADDQPSDAAGRVPDPIRTTTELNLAEGDAPERDNPDEPNPDNPDESDTSKQSEALLRTQLEDFSYDICPWYKSNNSNGGFGDVEFVERSQKFRSANRNGEN